MGSIPQEKLDELLALISDMLTGNVVAENLPRSLAGKAMHIASLLITWRPFLAQIWGALSSLATRAPKNCIWLKQILLSLLWMKSFLLQQSGTLTRVYDLHSYYGASDTFTITTDASPWGIGGWLAVNNRVIAYFADTISEDDCTVLQRERGCHTGQQAFEALALLVAYRLWCPLMKRQRSVLAVRNDNIGALTLMASLKTSGPAMGLIARELALDLAQSEYFPQVTSHLPGVANVTADVLSRQFDPNKQPYRVPFLVRHLSPTVPPPRHPAWWRARALELSFTAG